MADSHGPVRSNNSFKPNLLRSTKAMAEKACHGFGSTTQVGLTQALGGVGAIKVLPTGNVSILALSSIQFGRPSRLAVIGITDVC